MKVGSWVRRQGWMVDRRRKPTVSRKAAPEDSTTGESRRLDREGEAGRLAADASRRLAGRHSRRVDRRRKLEIGVKAS